MRRYRAANKERISEANRRYREENHEAMMAYKRQWDYANRERIREKDKLRYREFGRRGERKSYPAYYAEWREKNAERIKAYRVSERGRQVSAEATARRRSRLRGVLVEKVDRLALYERDGGRCHLCDRKVPRHAFHLDHLIPLSKGGPHTAQNLRVAHPSCNVRRKDGKLPAQLLLIG